MLDVVFFDCINFILQFCEMFYNVPAWGPVRKHFIFYILNIYVCTWLVCIVHIHRHHMQRPLSLKMTSDDVCSCFWLFPLALSPLLLICHSVQLSLASW